ncbi:hypothetical protein CBR_g39574 [Chara braunii]|uniref:Right handed beta helix domain-containing protein n=1 Tax=Chara braunii TaxID=69332 RepID=A0A388K1F5_CHABU|nr:hypothetical protein CBR_g39574 [Chara braunii]|eukprot:GBG63793.1 hypothetical protein CBR_g39574 [Chara braunii]
MEELLVKLSSSAWGNVDRDRRLGGWLLTWPFPPSPIPMKVACGRYPGSSFFIFSLLGICVTLHGLVGTVASLSPVEMKLGSALMNPKVPFFKLKEDLVLNQSLPPIRDKVMGKMVIVGDCPGGRPCRIDGGGRFRGFVGQSNLKLVNLELANFFFDTTDTWENGGAAVNIRGADKLVIKGCIFRGNSVTGGGGGAISVDETVILIDHSLFVGNTAHGGGGGAILADSFSHGLVQNSHFQGNIAFGNETCGGAILNSESTLTGINCSFDSNIAELGGAVCAADEDASQWKFFNSSFSGNRARSLKGADVYFGIVGVGSVFHNCTFSSSSASSSNSSDDAPTAPRDRRFRRSAPGQPSWVRPRSDGTTFIVPSGTSRGSAAESDSESDSAAATDTVDRGSCVYVEPQTLPEVKFKFCPSVPSCLQVEDQSRRLRGHSQSNVGALLMALKFNQEQHEGEEEEEEEDDEEGVSWNREENVTSARGLREYYRVPLNRTYMWETDTELEKKISEWVANLSLGEDEEAESYVTKDEKAALAVELAAMTDPMERREREDEQKLAWKLRMKREKKRRREEVNKMTAAVAKVQECRVEVLAQPDDKAKWDKVLGYLEVLSKAWMEERQASWSQDVALSTMRSGFKDFVREIVTHIGGEVKQLRDNVGKFCEGAIQGAKAAAAVEGEAIPREDPVKLKFLDTYGGKKDENFDNWEASVNSYIYLQHILMEEQVLVSFQALKDEAASFARSLARTAGCENNLVAYSKVTPLSQFLKLLKERFADPTRGIRASDKLQTIHSRQWRSAKALKGTMDDLVAVPDHGITEPQLVQLFYRAIPEALRGHFFDKSQQAGMTYDALSREVVLYESKSMPVTTFWHKDLEKGKKWKNCTISGQVKAKDHMILTLEAGGTDEVPYDLIEWGLEDDGSSVGRGGLTLLSRLEGGRKEEEEARAKGARPWEADDRAHRGLADRETAKREVGVKVPRQIAKVFGPHNEEVEGHLKEVGTQACHRAGPGKTWVWTDNYGRNA